MGHPFADLPPSAFWRTAVSDLAASGPSAPSLGDIYRPRFQISRTDRIVAAGSCFAQHIGAQLKRRGYGFVDAEPGPRHMEQEALHRFGFDLYSARYGNIYSMRQLLQLFQRAHGLFEPAEREWRTGGRFHDPFRPTIEPNGFASPDEREASTAFHLERVATLLRRCDVFVFTFGLTEAWLTTADGAVLPTCPGTVAGTFDPERYAFRNFSFPDVYGDAARFIALARRHNPAMRFVFTVSPVPLTATASGDHVLAATLYSKSVLRAVCGSLRDAFEGVDYFPSYELVSSHPMRARAYSSNLRTVTEDGVAEVMDVFFRAHGDAWERDAEPARPGRIAVAPPPLCEDDAVCDEALLEAFAR